MKSIKDPVEIRKFENFIPQKNGKFAHVTVTITPIVKEKSPEEVQQRCNMMSDYMSYQEGPEEDETREQPEEYWKDNPLKSFLESTMIHIIYEQAQEINDDIKDYN